MCVVFFFQPEDGIRDYDVTGVQTVLFRSRKQHPIAMKLFPRFSIRTYRRRLASFDSVPQFAILGLASGFVTGLVIIAFRLAIEWPLGYLLFDGPESFESLHPLVAFGLPLAGAIILIPIVAIFSDSDRSVGVVHALERPARHLGHMPR